MLTWLIDYDFFGLHPTFYHLTNLLIHLVNSWLLARLINTLAGHQRYGWLVAFLFCVYPGHPEAVTWIAGRFDLLSLSGQLLSLQWLVKAYQQRQVLPAPKQAQLSLAGAVLFYLLALFAKEEAIFLPLLVLVYLLLELGYHRERLRQQLKFVAVVTLAYLVASGFYLTVRLVVLGSFNQYEVADYNPLHFLGTPLLDALLVLVAPLNRVWLASYGLLIVLLTSAMLMLFFAALAFLIFKAAKASGSRFGLLVGVCLAWILGATVPALVLPYLRDAWKLGDLDGSRAFYSASVGVCSIVGIGLVEASTALVRQLAPARFNLQPKFTVRLVGLAITVFYLALLVINNQSWVTAGQQANEITQSMAEVKAVLVAAGDDIPGTRIVVTGLPEKYKGAYVALNMFVFANNPGEVFYNLKVPVVPDASTTEPDVKKFYAVKYNLDHDHVILNSIVKLSR